ncbi:MAG: TerD family protein [Campylobacteraceae bacterium]|jgi:stress response protein SCP2|nr:TerD family protein [Campylobacteraceae bacterium]
MAVSLKKGQGVSLKKSENDLSTVTIGLGWDVKEEKKGFIAALLGGGGQNDDYDLDAVAFLCHSDGKIHNAGNNNLVGGDIVFFNNLRHSSGAIWLTGDNRTGAGEGDDEQIIVKLNDLPAQFAKIVFVVQIYQGIQKRQSFGNIKNAFIRAVDGKGKEMVRFDLSGGEGFSQYRSLLFAELIREDGGWKFNAIGSPDNSDSFVNWAKRYI